MGLAMRPHIHLGINTCFAVKRWPEPHCWIRIITDELGLDSCQLSLDLVDPMLDERATAGYADAIRAEAATRRLLVHSTFTGLAAYSSNHLLHPDASMRDAAERWYERAIDFSARVGALATGGHLGALSVQDAQDRDRAQFLVRELHARLRSLARYAARKGLQFLLFENMAVNREWGYSIEQAMSLAGISVAGGVPLVLCLDVGHPGALHTDSPTDDYLEWLRRPWPHPPIIHLQQSDRTGDHHWPFTPERNLAGIIRAESILEVIRGWQAAEHVYLFLEPIHPFEAEESKVLQDLRESVQYWRAALDGAC
jgi:sugar phosphate isomerase/epimerase